MEDIKKTNEKIELKEPEAAVLEEKQASSRKNDRVHGTKMVLEQYIKWLDLDGESLNVSSFPYQIWKIFIVTDMDKSHLGYTRDQKVYRVDWAHLGVYQTAFGCRYLWMSAI